MSELDFFGFAAYAFVFLGGWYCQKKETAGWLMRMFGCLMWVIIGIRLGMYSIWLGELAFAAQAYVAYREWRKEDEWVEESEAFLDERTRADLLEALNDEEDLIWKDPSNPFNDPGLSMAAGDLIETVKRQSKGKKLAKGRSRSSAKKVRPARGRRSKSSNGVGRRRPNVKPARAKKSGSHVRVQKDNRRANAKGARTGKA